MKRYVVTGAPGAGKTAVLHELRDRGYAVVDEAATDVIAMQQAEGVDEPWTRPAFVDDIVAVQRARQESTYAELALFDRSPVCTLALARYLQVPVTDALGAEVDRVVREEVYDRRVLFVRPLGFVVPTGARRISYEESLVFERLHEEAYREHGFELVDIPPADVVARADLAESLLA